MTETKVMTELETLKKKKKAGKASAEDLVRLKQLIDGEPLSAADLDNAKQREAERAETAKAEFAARQKTKAAEVPAEAASAEGPTATLDVPADHPRIAALKTALLPFTQIEAHSSRPNEFVLFNRGIAITAGDVRAACEAMRL